MDFFLRTKKDLNNDLHTGQIPYFWGQGENDLIVDTNGDFALTEGIDLLNQGISKILVTERGHNLYFSAYGSGLQDLIGTNIDIDYLRAKVKMEIIDALRIYQFINQGVENLDEQIATLQSLRVDLSGTFGGLDVSFIVVTRSGRTTGSLVSLEG